MEFNMKRENRKDSKIAKPAAAAGDLIKGRTF
jgi:hypothetical protein